MLSPEELFKLIESGDSLTVEMENILLELDTTNSVTTQAELNDLLVKLYERLKKGDHIRSERTGEFLLVNDFINWVNTEFTDYSSNMFTETIAEI